jgi:hypothetical protein
MIFRFLNQPETNIVAKNSDDLELDAIDDAYQDKLKDLFGKLVTLLMVNADGHGGEQRSADQFATGLGFARRAREIALDAVKAPGKTQAKGKDA